MYQTKVIFVEQGEELEISLWMLFPSWSLPANVDGFLHLDGLSPPFSDQQFVANRSKTVNQE
ncbi:MAG: hypothetical protein Q9169_007303 [Polycauliona sp. 2 TL-2023]